MKSTVQIELLPLGKVLRVKQGAALQEVLFAEGVEFPCGGRGRCKGCRVKVLAGDLPPPPGQESLLSPEEIAAGWRLACQGRANDDLRLELAQWEAAILSDESPFAFAPRPGLGVAIDLGTTTLVAQVVDLQTGHVLGVITALNQQARHGADIMSRVDFALSSAGRAQLQDLVRRQIGGLIDALLLPIAERRAELNAVVIAGNTVMHHLFCGLDISPLAHHPFEPTEDGLKVFSPADLEWNLPAGARVAFLPCLGGFVGSDILCGILATGLHESSTPAILLDLGTNGEMVVGNRDKLLCASTAAGPAFEGARISMGMRAATGAIAAVEVAGSSLQCRVLGEGPARGLCGSGLVDAVAGGLELGLIHPSGRLLTPPSLMLSPPVGLSQGDIRELQLAKGAIAAGLRILLAEWGVAPGEVRKVCLAGAFGNYINRASARRIGLLDFPLEKIVPVGNTALLGAKMVLGSAHAAETHCAKLRKILRHVPLNENNQFQEIFAEAMLFPETS